MFPIITIEHPTKDHYGVIHKGMNEYAAQYGMSGTGGYFYVVFDEKNEIIAAISGFDNFGPVEIGGLWVHEDHRNQGYGKGLVKKAEEWGKQKGCLSATVFTIKDWPAFEFYQCLGFQIEFERVGHSQGSIGCYLIKNLS